MESRLPRRLRNTAELVAAPGQVLTGIEPNLEAAAQNGMEGDLAVVAALAVADDQVALAGGGTYVAEIEGADLAEAQPGVEPDQGELPVAGGSVLGGAQPADLRSFGQGSGAALGRSSRRAAAGPRPRRR
jgi:hypothetical protein